MGAGLIVGGAIVAFVLFGLFVPVFSFALNSVSAFGINAQVSVQASLFFEMFHCGSYTNARITSSGFGFSGSHQLSSGYNFACSFSSS